MATASPTPFVNIPKLRDTSDHSGTAIHEKKATMALLTPPTSTSPELPAHPGNDGATPPEMDIEQEMDIQPSGVPLSRGALSDLDGAQTITPPMLAKHHLPGILLGNGPCPIRHVMGELTQTVPGFSRIPVAKARRIVVAALENPQGGGPDGNIEFNKTGWGKWDAHYKGSSRDSAIGSFNDGRLSPPRSERSYAVSYSDSAINIPGQHFPAKYRDQHSGGSWGASSLREEDEFDMDMIVEDEADNMSMDGLSDEDEEMEDDDDDATDPGDWAAVGIDALRKASLPTPNAPRSNYRATSQPYYGQWASKLRRPSATPQQPPHSASVPVGGAFPGLQTPEENAAVAALMSMGSM
ncbi:hypothetical protein PRZ48_002013 [Zasmidium cellare]|uniref:Sin3 binding protein-domain-containing protein n=1 Tax=Zasmidium cellare TaxID=395010 RepID=A0ABR0F4P5_ZASCE|nr:hypothetical protein PRZ48_002013 [Zasmidium cellare]